MLFMDLVYAIISSANYYLKPLNAANTSEENKFKTLVRLNMHIDL